MGQWSNGAPKLHNGSSPLHKSTVISNASALSQQSAMAKARSVSQHAKQATSLSTELNKLDITTSTNADSPTSWNPSTAPAPSQFSEYQRPPSMVGSRFSTRSQAQGIRNQVCKLSGYTKHDYQLGEIISIPFHTPNHNPRVNTQDPNLSYTNYGTVYSKRRMVIVLWVYEEILFCVPLYTFDKKGLKTKPKQLKPEYVSVRNASDEEFVNQGLYPPIAVHARRPLDVDTTVHITGGLAVMCKEDIARCGRLTKDSYTHLVNLWNHLYDAACQQSF